NGGGASLPESHDPAEPPPPHGSLPGAGCPQPPPAGAPPQFPPGAPWPPPPKPPPPERGVRFTCAVAQRSEGPISSTSNYQLVRCLLSVISIYRAIIRPCA